MVLKRVSVIILWLFNVLLFRIIDCDATKISNDGIYFPTDDLVTQVQRKRDIYTPSINETECRGKTICDDVLNYPENYIEKLFETNTTNYDHFFGHDEIFTEIESRLHISDGGEPFCQSRKHLERPKAGTTDKNEWFFLVNHGKYIQAIEIDICENENNPCKILTVKSKCVQKYIFRKLLAVDPNGKMIPKTIKLPSCCSCHFA